MVDPGDEETALILRLVSYLDHEFANHLQLIEGWLKLGEVGKAREAGVEALQSVRARSALRHLLVPRDAAAIIKWLAEASLKGVATNVQVRKRMGPLSPGARQALFDALGELVQVCYRVDLDIGDGMVVTGYLLQYQEAGECLRGRPNQQGAKIDGDQVEVRIGLEG